MKDLKLDKTSKGSLSQFFMLASVVFVVFAALGYMGMDIWLASTQWLLAAAVSGLFGIYMKMV